MAENFKVSGKRASIPKADGEWCFTTRPGGWILAERKRADGTIERRRLLMAEKKGRLAFHLDGQAWSGEVQESRAGGAAGGGSDSDLIAQFPGKIRKVLVKAGELVEEGQPLLMVEAMKMEFPVKAPFAGVVKQVRVTEAQQISPGDRFIDLEAAPNGKASS